MALYLRDCFLLVLFPTVKNNLLGIKANINRKRVDINPERVDINI